MSNYIVINAERPETRVAVLENNQIVEIQVERHRERQIVGNIYKGRVSRVLPGMQAAFVDIGTDKAAFLYIDEVQGATPNAKFLFDDEEEAAPRPSHNGPKISDLLKAGQEILLQVTKAPISTKGCRSSSYISLPGRNLVFMPTVDHIGLSRRITDEKDRKRLRGLIDSMRPQGSGFIVRTVAALATDEEIKADVDFLVRLWNSIKKKYDTVQAPTLLYNDLDLLLRTVRDVFTPDIEKVIIDNAQEYERLLKFTRAFMPQFAHRIEHYTGREPIFDHYGIEKEIERGLQRKVSLKSGGTLLIEQGEALTSIDVNTGRFVGKHNLEETITKTNLEACEEVADQLRLRNIGGIIIIDFIDMDRQDNREKVMRVFAEKMKHDRAKTNIMQISELGLIEMTRKRTKESLGRTLTETCFYCEGNGYLKSKLTIGYEILRQIRREGLIGVGEAVIAKMHPQLVELLKTNDREYLVELETQLSRKIILQPEHSFHIEKYEISTKSKDATSKIEPVLDETLPAAN